MISAKKMAFKLAAALAATVAGADPAISAGTPVDWCTSGGLETAEGPRTSLGPGAVVPVSEAHRPRAERRLQRRPLVRVSGRYAQKVTGVPSPSRPGYRYVLVRAGLVGSPGVSISEHLERSGRIHFVAELSSDRKKLIVWTLELSPPFATRRLPVIAMVPNTVVEAASRCSSST